MRRRLYIHIGAPKTGSTFLQRKATHLRSRLRESGLLYPEATARGFGHHDIAFLVSGGYPDWAKPQDRTLKELGAEIESEAADFDGDVLISSENFYLFPAPEALHKFLEDHPGLVEQREIRFVAYTRRQDELFLSWYNQKVKALGFSGSFDDAMPSMEWMGDYATQFTHWANVFGKEALDVADYRRSSGTEGGLWADFTSRLGVNIRADTSNTDTNVNIRLNRDVLEVQRIINRLPLSVVEKRSFHQQLMALSAKAADIFSDAPLVSDAWRRKLLERFKDSNDILFTNYITSGNGFDIDELADRPAPDYPGISQETVLAVVSWLVLRYRGESEF